MLNVAFGERTAKCHGSHECVTKIKTRIRDTRRDITVGRKVIDGVRLDFMHNVGQNLGILSISLDEPS